MEGEVTRQEEHIELIASKTNPSPSCYAGAGISADQQICRRLSR